MTIATSDPRPSETSRGAPVHGAAWWRFGMVWFALSGPAIVVVAGFVTLAICIKYPDVELHETPVVAAAHAPAPNSVKSATWQPGEDATVSGH